MKAESMRFINCCISRTYEITASMLACDLAKIAKVLKTNDIKRAHSTISENACISGQRIEL